MNQNGELVPTWLVHSSTIVASLPHASSISIVSSINIMLIRQRISWIITFSESIISEESDTDWATYVSWDPYRLSYIRIMRSLVFIAVLVSPSENQFRNKWYHSSDSVPVCCNFWSACQSLTIFWYYVSKMRSFASSKMVDFVSGLPIFPSMYTTGILLAQYL